MTCFVGDDAAGNDDDIGFMEQASDLADRVNNTLSGMRGERILADAYKRESSATGYSYPQANKRLIIQGIVVQLPGHQKIY